LTRLAFNPLKTFLKPPKTATMITFVTQYQASQLLYNKFVVILGGSGEWRKKKKSINRFHFNAVHLQYNSSNTAL